MMSRTMIAEAFAFVLAATALLGSPGPGITALVAVGRSFPRRAAVRFYGAMQLGLAIAAAVSVAGLTGVLSAFPVLQTVLMILATIYLLWLAWTIASAPVGGTVIGDAPGGSLTSKGAFFLGVANPKAYLAFASLFGSFALLPSSAGLADGALKWLLCVAVMVVVDLGWLVLGMVFGTIALSPRGERLFNILMGTAVLGACVATWL
jgi:threonine/homoserine/homoserine lactone efflux protein